MENTVSDRVNLLIATLGYNKRTFSMKLGLSNDVTIGRIVNEKREPSYKILTSIIQTFGNINANWLLTGKGEMFLDAKGAPVGGDVIARNAELLKKIQGCDAFIAATAGMEPEIQAGDVLGVMQVGDIPACWDYLVTGKKYLIVTSAGQVIAFVKESNHPDFIVCSTPGNAPFKVAKSNVTGLYRIQVSVHSH